VSEKSIGAATSAGPTLHYILFARSGFTPALEAVARDEGVLLVNPSDLLADLPPV